MRHCMNTTQAHNATDIYRPIEREVMRVELEQNKFNEAYKIIEDHNEITDLAFSDRLFMYKNELADEQKEQERYLKDDYDRYMEELSRPAA